MENPLMSYITVDETQYGIIWQDRGDHKHLKIFKDNKLLGFKNFALRTDTSDGTITWTIRALLNGVKFKNEFNKTKT
jgi:hypothetical protein